MNVEQLQQGDWIREAELRRDLGIERGSAHAAAEIPGWKDQAYDLLLQYVLIQRGKPFLAEAFVAWAKERMESPPDARAWGHPVRRAASRHLIQASGVAKAATSNCSLKTLWVGVD